MYLCSGCGHTFELTDPAPFRCPRAGSGDDLDHVVVAPPFDPDEIRAIQDIRTDESHPFLRYADFLGPYRMARNAGVSFGVYREIVEDVDRRVAKVAGTGFRVTPLRRHETIERALMERFGLEEGLTAEVWAKDETANVGGSHKGRHLMAIVIHLRLAQHLGWIGSDPPPRLAVASCGSAAFAAALLARAVNWPLEVFVPDHADSQVLEKIRELGAQVTPCARTATTEGDPCVAAFRQAVSGGAVPFSVQGPENGLVIEGGLTLGLELAEQGIQNDLTLGDLYLQVGGGAFATSTALGLQLNARWHRPRIHAVQTEAIHPLSVAYDHYVDRLRGGEPREISSVAIEVRREAAEYAAAHRSEFMIPWPTAPRSVARGILDDETYDWRQLLSVMVESLGSPALVSEEMLESAHAMVQDETTLPPSVTGTAGLAGLLKRLRRDPTLDRNVGFIWTGIW